MSNSKYVSFTMLSPYYNERGNNKILKITPHHAAAVGASLSAMGNVFRTRDCSANYGIDSDGNIAMYVPEDKRAWTSCNANNDYHAVTIEIANSGAGPNWPISAKAWDALVKLCVDICQRNGIEALVYTGDTKGNLTRHNMFVATACPGPYLQGRFPELAQVVNEALGSAPAEPVPTPAEPEPETNVIYRVQVGAYSVKKNADEMRSKLVKDGYTPIVVVIDGLYKVQVGAFKKLENAEALQKKLKAKGYQTIITEKTGSAVVSNVIKVGSRVKFREGAPAYNGALLAPFVYKRTYLVSALQGDRAVCVYNGVIVAAMKTSDLILVS